MLDKPGGLEMTTTTTLTTYRGVMEKDGLVRLRHAPALPVGTEVLAVIRGLARETVHSGHFGRDVE